MTQTTPAPPDLAQRVAWLEGVLPVGYALVRTRHAWYLKRHESYFTRSGDPRLDFHDVDSDKSLSALLARLGEP